MKVTTITQNSLDTRELKTIWNKCRNYLSIHRIQASNLANRILWSLTAGDEQQWMTAGVWSERCPSPSGWVEDDRLWQKQASFCHYSLTETCLMQYNEVTNINRVIIHEIKQCSSFSGLHDDNWNSFASKNPTVCENKIILKPFETHALLTPVCLCKAMGHYSYSSTNEVLGEE